MGNRIAIGTGTRGFYTSIHIIRTCITATSTSPRKCAKRPRAGKIQMTEVAQRQELEQAVPLAALFTAFLAVSLYGVGGASGIVWARRIAVEKRRWISDTEFADIVSLCQFMPGPNIVGIAVCVGAKMRGTIGTIAAVSGFLVIPWVIGLAVGLLFLEYAHLTVLRHILGGIAAAAAGLLIATGIRLLLPHRRRPAALLFAVLAFGLMTFAKLPLLAVLFILLPLSIAVAGIEGARAR
jgi:chromate transporter